MRRLQLNLNRQLNEWQQYDDIRADAKEQGFILRAKTLRNMAYEIRDNIGLKRCTRVLDSFIFTEL